MVEVEDTEKKKKNGDGVNNDYEKRTVPKKK